MAVKKAEHFVLTDQFGQVLGLFPCHPIAASRDAPTGMRVEPLAGQLVHQVNIPVSLIQNERAAIQEVLQKELGLPTRSFLKQRKRKTPRRRS